GVLARRGDDALRLDGLSSADVARLRDELLHRHDAIEAEVALSQEVLVAAEPSWVRYAPFTLSGFVTVFVVLGFAWRVVTEAHVDPRRLTTVSGELVVAAPWLTALVGGVVLLVVSRARPPAGSVSLFGAFARCRTPAGGVR